METRKSPVVVVGSANVDLTVRVTAMPRPGETVLGSDLTTAVGGKGANQAVAAALLGACVQFVGCRGDDDSGQLIEHALQEAGVGTKGLRTVPGPSGTALITLAEDGENAIIVSSGANRQLDERSVRDAAAAWDSATFVVLQLECPQPAVDAAVAAASAANARVVVNAAPARTLPVAVLQAADPLVVNETECDFYLGKPGRTAQDPGAAARDLLELGPRSAVVTVGPGGAVLAERSTAGDVVVTRVQGVPAHAVDTTGAGDAFVGALVDGLARGLSLASAAQIAVRVGAFAVERLGAQPSYPSLADLKAACKRWPLPVQADPRG